MRQNLNIYEAGYQTCKIIIISFNNNNNNNNNNNRNQEG